MPTNEPLSQKADKILEVIKQHEGEWIKRSEIASALGKKVLNSGDLVLLRYLEEQGQIKSVSVPTNAPSGVRAEYKAVK